MRIRRVGVLVVVVLTAALGVSSAAGAGRPHPNVTLMTRNLYLGADLLPLAVAAPGAPLHAAVDATLAHVEATGPTARMSLIAKEIAAAKPDLVGLQEVSVWSSGPIGGKATHVIADYLKTIMFRAEATTRPVSRRGAASEPSPHGGGGIGGG